MPAYVPETGDVVWLQFDPQAGHEQAGHRPALVLTPSRYNAARGMMICCPLTSKIKGYAFEVVIGGPLFFTPSALALFLVTTGVSICLGHSLGMHRRLIHRAYECPRWLEHMFVYLGVLSAARRRWFCVCR